MIKWNSDLADFVHDFGLGMKRPVPAQRNGLAEWKVEIGDGVQDFKREALFPKCSFYEMQWNGLNNYENGLSLCSRV